MAAPTNWNTNNFRNPGNPEIMRHHNTQNQPFDFQRLPQSQGNRFSPRIPPQQVNGQSFNPRFIPPMGMGRPCFNQNSSVMQNRFQSSPLQQSQNNNPFFQGDPGLQLGQNFQNSVPYMPLEQQNPAQFPPDHIGMHHHQPFTNDSFSDEMNAMQLHDTSQTTLQQGRLFQQPQPFRSVEEEQNREDQQWLKNWLQRKSVKMEEKLQKPNMKICEAQEKTRHMIVLLARLQKNRLMLETFKFEDKSIWDQKLKEVLSIKAELESVQKEVTNEENVRHLKAKVEQRKKKRERLRHCKQEMYQRHQEELAEREHKSAEIDKIMQQLVEKQKLEKQEKDMQKEADEILSQVRKKLSEANRSMQVVNSLQKIRKLRTDRLERQGVLHMYEPQGHSSANRLMFEAKLGNVTELLKKQLEIYKAEEAALKIHLETEQEETREKERENARQRMIEKQKQQRKKEEKMLFGNQKDPIPGDPLYPFRQYYDSASHSLEALVAIRQEWDRYLTTPAVGSCIPEDWVIPAEPTSNIWATALQSGQTT